MASSIARFGVPSRRSSSKQVAERHTTFHGPHELLDAITEADDVFQL